jgi:hypothetical protein
MILVEQASCLPENTRDGQDAHPTKPSRIYVTPDKEKMTPIRQKWATD